MGTLLEKGDTHGDGGGLREEADEVEAQLAARRERDARRDHEHDHSEPLTRLLDPERPRNEQDRNGRERLPFPSVSATKYGLGEESAP